MFLALGGELLAPHVDRGRVKNIFREQYTIDQFALLEQIENVGVPADVRPGGNFEREVEYGSPSSARKHAAEVWEKAVGDDKKWRAIVIPVRIARSARGLLVIPVRVVEKKGRGKKSMIRR